VHEKSEVNGKLVEKVIHLSRPNGLLFALRLKERPKSEVSSKFLVHASIRQGWLGLVTRLVSLSSVSVWPPCRNVQMP